MATRFDKLIERWDPLLRRAFLDAIYNLRANADAAQIERMLRAGNVEAALRAVGLDPVAFRPFDQAITNTFESGGIATADVIPTRRLADGFRVNFQFNIRNPAAERWLADHSSTLIRDVIDDQRLMIRDYLRIGLERGANPRTTALDLVGRIGASGRREGGVIGLTSSQAEWVRNYADALASDNPRTALARTLRDKRFDRAVIRAAESGEPIPAALRQTMIDAYENRALRFRAEAIARSETITALHEAQQEAMEQAIASDAVDQQAVTFVWHTAHDERVRDSHASMDGQEVAVGEKFTTGNGVELEFPGDPNGPPEEIINCRCWREPNVDFLAGLE